MSSRLTLRQKDFTPAISALVVSRSDGDPLLPLVKAAFKASGYKVKQLLIELAKTDAFHDKAA
ncbi:hypothetical protein WME76_22900 [Sorangium sp. So ce119]|uniref:hypothetical protein n=1 Tax=Sorangium sp. So ce119 TaxID=3133279 RepID=UPI003F5F6768